MEKQKEIKDFEFTKFEPRIHSPLKTEGNYETKLHSSRSLTPSACFLRTSRPPLLFKVNCRKLNIFFKVIFCNPWTWLLQSNSRREINI